MNSFPINVPCDALASMWCNARKAIEEHYSSDPNSYTSLEKGLPSIEELKKEEKTPISLKNESAVRQGLRLAMEDAHFFLEKDDRALIGVFDGHGGANVAEFAKDYFQSMFFVDLSEVDGDIHQAFQKVVDEVHAEVKKESKWDKQGTTAVVSYIDKKTHLIYTATIGDSEANIYRNKKSVPLSCVRDWLSSKDFERLQLAHSNDQAIEAHVQGIGGDAKDLRAHISDGVNVSRAIGDAYYESLNGCPLVTQKAKVTVNKLQPGDVVVLACDGLKDFMPESKIIEAAHVMPSGLAYVLASHAVNKHQSDDNVTVNLLRIS